MATKTAKGKAKAKDADATAVVTGKGNRGRMSIAERAGKKAKAPKSAPGSSTAPEVTVDMKLPGHAAKRAELKEEATEVQARVEIYGKMAKSKDKAVAAEAKRLTEASKAQLVSLEADLAKSGLVVDEWVAARKAKGDAEKRMKDAFGIIGPILEGKRIELSRARREELSSLQVAGGPKYIAGSMITGLTGENLKTKEQLDNREEELRAVFGDRHEEFILRKTQMSLNMDVLGADPDFADGLFDAIIAFCEEQGRDVTDVVDEKDTLSGTRALVTARVMDPKGQDLFDEAKAEGLLGLKAAHLREGK